MKLHKNQIKALESFFSPDITQLLIKGGFGSGKTFIASYIAYIVAHIPNAKLLFTRSTLREIENTMIPAFLEHAQEQEKIFIENNINLQNQIIKTPWNSTIFYLSSSEKDEQFKKLRSYEFNFIWIDEASEISENAFQELLRRLRAPTPNFRKILLTSNPPDSSHWLYNYFIKNPSPNKVVITFSSLDNPFLPQDYIQQLLSLPPQLQQVIIHGDWGTLTPSKIFAFNPNENIIHNLPYSKIDILALSQESKVFASIDFGINASAVILALKNYSDQIIVFYEKLFENTPLTNIFDSLELELKEKFSLPLHNIIFCGDPAGSQRNLMNESAFSILQKYKNIYIRAKKIDIIQSINLVNFLLQKEIKNSPLQKKRALLISSDCPTLIKSFSHAYSIDPQSNQIKKNPPYEHILDALRYLISNFSPFSPPEFLSFSHILPH